MMVKAMANLKTTASVKPTAFAAIIVFTLPAVSILLIAISLFMMDSVSSDVSRIFSDGPIDPSIWLLIGGIVMFVTSLPACVPLLSTVQNKS